MQASSYSHFESQKKQHKRKKMNPCGSWWYIKVLWSKTITLCKKLNIIYNIITCNPELQAIIFHELVLSDSLFQITDSPVYVMTSLISNYIFKAPNNDMKCICFTCLKHVK